MKLLIIAGARPNFMKVAPLIKAIQRHNSQASPARRVDYSLIHTGQHYDERMSDIFFSELGIPAPNHNLGVGSGSHAVQTASIMLKFEPVCLAENPDWVVVVGDVNSTMACTLVASKLGIKVAHVEAGLRSFDRTMPEEINRLVTDALADLLLTPSADADENLRREGVPCSKIKLVGNIMIDALIENLPQARQSTLLGKLGLKKKHYAYVTLHRPSNVDDRAILERVMQVLADLSERIAVVFPMHPRTRKMLSGTKFDPASHSERQPDLMIVEPVGYHDSLCLTENAAIVLTDSGGLQEESTFLRTPCLTLRPNTERPVTITHGSNKLTTVSDLRTDLENVLRRGEPFTAVPPLWDGNAATRILQLFA